MIHLMMGLKGSGKTKKLVEDINAVAASANGDVVCIENGKKLTYDVSSKVRLIDAKEYGVSSPELMKGFLSGLHAGNYDITNVFVDNLYKILGDDVAANEAFILWAADFAKANDMEITMSVSFDPAAVQAEAVKAYL